MKLATSFLLPVAIGVASAISDASVYIFDANLPSTATDPPTLNPEQARLVFAQRLGVSQYHGVGDASETTLSYINTFGGPRELLFQDARNEKAAELVLLVEGVSSDVEGPLLSEWASTKPSFTISEPPSMAANKKLVLDLQRQSGQSGRNCDLETAINPFDTNCWNGRSNVIHFDLTSKTGGSKIDEFMAAQKRLVRFAKKEEMNVVVVLMPEDSRALKSSSKHYGYYELPSQLSVGKMRRQTAEEPMTEVPAASAPPKLSNTQQQSPDPTQSSAITPLPKLPQLCYASEEACVSSTNNCSDHGSCYKKFTTKKAACFTCGCKSTNEGFLHAKKQYYTTVNWGGSACHKRDVSSPFWLIAIFTVVLVGTVSWGIGLMYSIGEETLPGVIGAGVSSKSR
ncbi:conserved fungal protein [Drepanopeziza brunnea f. sp. 'multigermtubi' MB_m1]|uniref:Conserved fungal protein n=1 Tax=Marssonina brunnea f. sp. multigermtubi (strain MB_m1) TaxID=1072389 RepID=K1XCT5_MARBU|nr:uncharacterized protein MBM_03566 [Drepanopeziza brunnea f. sp. 'multigermtubi' MB_m1]EKD18573.1 conserved fungal protein [Drepanopeziza brunnea f. sp. 'multigermtubi' MB_m1]